MTRIVLITGARSPAALELARAVRNLGAEPHLADCAPARVARWSSSPARVHRYAPPLPQPEAFQQDILRLVAELDPVAIVPTCEEVFHLAAPGLSSTHAGLLLAPPLETLHRLHRKDSFAELIDQLGLRAPQTIPLRTRSDLDGFRGDEKQWVFKPCYSRFGSRAVVSPASVDELSIDLTEPWIAQRRVRGREACFYAIARDGIVMAFAAYRAEWQLAGGASYAFAPLDEQRASTLRSIADRIAAGLGVTGQFACDCIFDRFDDPWLLECNPRSTSGVHLCPEASAAAILGLPAQTASPPKPRHNLPMMLSYGVGSALSTGSLTRWAQSFLSGSDVVGRPGDRRPMLGAVIDALGFMLAARRLGVPLAAATTSDIEWNGTPLP